MTDKCTYCGNEIDNGAIYMDDSGIDGVFCNDDCADAFLLECIEKVDNE